MSERLVQLFERELRASARPDGRADPSKPRRVSGELDAQVIEFAEQVSASGSTPEQMLVELKGLLARAAPDVPSSRRNELVSSLTGRAIDAFFRKNRSVERR